MPNAGGRTIAVVDTAANEVINSIPVGQFPNQVAFLPDGTKAYVANNGSASVSVIDVATGLVTATIPVGLDPIKVTILPSGVAAYVLNFNGGFVGTVSVIDTTTDAVVATVPCGNNVQFIVAAPDSAHVYVNNNQDGTITQIQTSDNSHTTFSVPTPSGIAVAPDSATLYVSDSTDNHVLFINATTHVTLQTVVVGTTPTGPLVLLPNGTQIYIFNEGDDTTSIIDVASHTVLATLPNVGDFWLTASPDSTKVYGAHGEGDAQQVKEILTASQTIAHTFTVSGFPNDIAVTPNNAQVYVDIFAGGVDVINVAGSTVAPIPPGISFGTATILEPSSQFLVTNEGGGKIGLGIDTTAIPSPSFGPVTFNQISVAANQGGTDLIPVGFVGDDGVVYFVATRTGSIVGMSVLFTNSIGAGIATLNPTIDGETVNLEFDASSTSNAVGGVVTQPTGIDGFFPGDQIGIRLATSADFAFSGDDPTAGNLYVWIEIAEALA